MSTALNLTYLSPSYDGRWLLRAGEISSHDDPVTALQSLADAGGPGHTAVITRSGVLLESADDIRRMLAVDVCRPFDEHSERKLASLERAGTSVRVASDASVRTARRSSCSAVLYDGKQVDVIVRRIGMGNSYCAETAGVFSAIGAASGYGKISAACDSSAAVQAVNSLRGVGAQGISDFCRDTFGLSTYGEGRWTFESAMKTADLLDTGTASLQWVRGHDDEIDVEDIDHTLNVIADQSARAVSLPQSFDEQSLASVRGIIRELVHQRLPDARFRLDYAGRI